MCLPHDPPDTLTRHTSETVLLKKLRPSRWIAFLMLGWGICSMGLSGAHNFATVAALRFLLGVFEAGEETDPSDQTRLLTTSLLTEHHRLVPGTGLLYHFLVQGGGEIHTSGLHPRECHSCRCFRRSHRIWRGPYGPSSGAVRMAL